MNRISPVLDRLIGIEDPSELVTELEEVISDSVSAPEAGQKAAQVPTREVGEVRRGVRRRLRHSRCGALGNGLLLFRRMRAELHSPREGAVCS